MAESSLATTHQTIAIDQVVNVAVTDVVQDGDQFVRELRVFGQPDGLSGAPVFVLRISSTDATAVELQTPTLKF